MFLRMVLISGVALVAAAGAVAASSSMGPVMGRSSKISRPAFHGFYDGHKVTYLNTDVSNKADAATMHINYSAPIAPALVGNAADLEGRRQADAHHERHRRQQDREDGEADRTGCPCRPQLPHHRGEQELTKQFVGPLSTARRVNRRGTA
jgi:hypothetical protein